MEQGGTVGHRMCEAGLNACKVSEPDRDPPGQLRVRSASTDREQPECLADPSTPDRVRNPRRGAGPRRARSCSEVERRTRPKYAMHRFAVGDNRAW
jgi:hypothetical protein